MGPTYEFELGRRDRGVLVTETVDSLAGVSFTSLDYGAGEVWLIDGIGEVLGLETDAVVGLVVSPVLAELVYPVGGVDLNTGLGSQNL